MTTPKQPEQESRANSPIMPASGAWSGSRFLTRKSWPFLGLGLFILLGIGVWRLPVFQSQSWSVIFEERSFDPPTRRLALLELKTLGINHRMNQRGEIEVQPDQKLAAETALENKGLKPVTLDEIRTGDDSPLAILESIAQREQKQRTAKEKELAWLIQKTGSVGQTHVTIEPIPGSKRFINRGNDPKWRVRVFLEPLPDTPQTDAETVRKIESIVLASLPETAPGQITIHDSQTIYLMAGESRTDASAATLADEKSGTDPAHGTTLHQQSLDLKERIVKNVADLKQATIQIRLYEVTEQQKTDLTAAASSADKIALKPQLYLNEPVEIELPEPVQKKSGEESPKTTRARLQITLENQDAQTISPDFRKQIHSQISALIAPVLVEQIDWLDPPTSVVAQADTKIQQTSALNQNAPAGKQAQTAKISPLPGTEHGIILPMIFGVVVVVVIGGSFLIWGTVRSRTIEPDRDWIRSENGTQWARDLVSAVTPGEPHFENMAEKQAAVTSEKAARVLGDWISDDFGNADEDHGS